MSSATYEIYCDKSDDEELAQVVFADGPLASARIVRLPTRPMDAPIGLREFLRWERSDWLVLRDGIPVAAAELSRHGYTGDNGFQRFARLHRAASLGIPGVYFTPFSRSRLNEVDLGRVSPRNVAPEMFGALLQAGREFDTPCLALRWPTDADGEPLPLGESRASHAVRHLRDLITGFATRAQTGPIDWGWIPEPILADMTTQAQLAHRVSEVRFSIPLPIAEVESSTWLHSLLAEDYFRRGKADKILAKLALDQADFRPMRGTTTLPPFWTKTGNAQVLYLGYQWRPDPSSGLIAFSGTLARAAGRPLIVVWPRVFLDDGRLRQEALRALRTFREHGDGPIHDVGVALGRSADSLAHFRDRVNPSSDQFGVYTPRSKVGRILEDNADLCVFGDALLVP